MTAASRAVVEDIEGGARIDITPNDPANVDQLRTAIRNRVAQMQETGSCAMGQPSAPDTQASPGQQGDPDPQGSPGPQPRDPR